MDKYTPRPAHQLIPAIIILIAGMVLGAFDTWQAGVAFVATVIIAIATGLWIAIAGTLEKYTEYWDSVGEDIRRLQKANPNTWHALGFTNPPESVKVQVNVTGEQGESLDYAVKNFSIPVTPAEMATIADSILTGAKTFAESDWKDTEIGQTKIRLVKQEMLRMGFLVANNAKNPRLGFTITQKGLMLLYQYASDWVKTDTNLHVISKPVTTPLSEGYIPPKL